MVIFAVVAAFAALRGGGAGNGGTDHPGVGQRLLGLELEPVTGAASVFTSADLDGRVTLVNLWGTWCGPCRQEFPHIVQLHRRYGERSDFQLLSISLPGAPKSLTELQADTERFLTHHDAEFDTYTDYTGSNVPLIVSTAKLPGSSIPLTLILDKQARIRGIWQGFAAGDAVAMESLLQSLLDDENHVALHGPAFGP